MVNHVDQFVFPAKENDFLGHGSLEAFVRRNAHKLMDQPKKGAFKITMEVGADDLEPKTFVYFLLRDIRIEPDFVVFYNLYCDSLDKDSNEDGSHIPQRKPDETMLQYFDRLEKELNACWIEQYILQPLSISIHGQFTYFDDTGVVDSVNKFAFRYKQAVRKPKKGLKTVETSKQDNSDKTDKVVTLASRREPHDKSD